MLHPSRNVTDPAKQKCHQKPCGSVAFACQGRSFVWINEKMLKFSLDDLRSMDNCFACWVIENCYVVVVIIGRRVICVCGFMLFPADICFSECPRVTSI